MKRLENKRALVTGAASGIGRATAIRLAEEGAWVLATDVNDDGIAATVAAITEAGGKAVGATLDVSDAAAVDAMVKRAVDEGGGLEICHANAGITGSLLPILDVPPEDWEQVFRVNFLGAVYTVTAAAKHMSMNGGGSIICTASVAGLRAGAGPSPYSASKAALINLVQTSAVHLAGTGVRVNAICPGLIETGMTKPVFDYARENDKFDRIGQLNPTKRAGQPEEIASVVAFLASDDASYVDGQAIVVDGGLSASHPFARGSIF